MNEIIIIENEIDIWGKCVKISLRLVKLLSVLLN